MVTLSTQLRNSLLLGVAAVGFTLLTKWLNITIRPLALFFLGIFSFWFCKTRCNLRIIPPPELQVKIDNIVKRVNEWRQNNPKMFMRVLTGCLCTLALFGHFISGSTVVLTGLIIAAILSAKYKFQLLQVKSEDYMWTEKLVDEPEPDDEFLPEVNESNLFVLERAGDLASISSVVEEAEDDNSDEIPSELLIPDAIPEIDESSTEEDDELVPIEKIDAKTKEIEFKRGHFKRDSSLSSSSSSEESLSKGLQFPDHTTVDSGTVRLRQIEGAPLPSQIQKDINAPPLSNLVSKGQQIVPNILSGIIQWGLNAATTATTAKPIEAVKQQRVVTALDSSDDSDFEILDKEDFKNEE
ncbi:uncharacterized protein LOC119671800 [Teleopsis dalmanni]|uniref:uncharacterized protein LOC119671800 n=1 Tax=Teleopsis dalmanni TaxID=139649 RepID=UPI0018CEB542|nr:uncharacterized protein LOC119671800 [Teleopsis dalmanni]XP_037938514.1 uncharacterized protein LOC119671800 [Teleopsis dalmanni]XP_037938515.1 uncharacterized protein LOC119671800 [Teleopsis dalmanni]